MIATGQLKWALNDAGAAARRSFLRRPSTASFISRVCVKAGAGSTFSVKTIGEVAQSGAADVSSIERRRGRLVSGFMDLRDTTAAEGYEQRRPLWVRPSRETEESWMPITQGASCALL